MKEDCDHGFQIWLNMPSRYKFSSPATDVHKETKMASIVTNKYSVKIILGELMGKKSLIELLSPAFYYHIKMKDDSKIEIPTDPTHNAVLYLINGKAEVQGRKEITANQVVLYNRNASMLNIYSRDGAELLMLGGKPLNERVYSYGPFVMNTEEEINRCIHDYNAGKMGDPDLVNNPLLKK